MCGVRDAMRDAKPPKLYQSKLIVLSVR